MSKKKKTIQKLLEEALLPEEEQPYDVPANWIWTKLGIIGEIGSSKRVLQSEWKSEGIPFYRAREIVSLNKNEKIKNGIFISEELYYELALKYGIPDEGDLLITAVGTIGQPYIVKKEDKFYFKDASVIWFKNNTKQSIEFINLFFKSSYAQNQIKSMSAGTTVDTYTISNAKQTLIPLPPLNEQKRIAEKVERLLNKIEEAKQLIEEAKETFEIRRAAILEKAFRGELTRKWRAQQGVGMESWEETELQEQTSLLGDGIHGTPKYSDEGEFFFINGNNFDGFSIVIKPGTKRVNIEEYEKYKKNLTNQTVFVSINGTLGKTALYNGEPIILGKSACYFNVKETLDKRFIRYYLETREFLDYAHTMATGSTIKNLSLKAMRNLPLHLPSLLEQQEIVRILDSFYEKEQKEKELFNEIDKIDQIKQSILSKAFRGELGTNDLNEENAIELLKEVLQEQVK